jgi:DNA-binding transcriptional LysR family regulator
MRRNAHALQFTRACNATYGPNIARGAAVARPDLNLLVTLDVLLAEGSVARAARRLRLSPSAMSRALSRLRETLGDPLLVRSGRGLTPTPRAMELRERTGPLLEAVEEVLRPARMPDLRTVSRVFVLRTSDGFVENFGAPLVARAATEAPGVRLRFLQKPDRESTGLRDGSVDLETGVVGQAASPEVRTQLLFRDRRVGVVRAGPVQARGKVSAARYVAARHVRVSRQGDAGGPVDDALAALGLERDVAVTVSGFAAAIALAAASDLVATVPERHTGNLRTGLGSFPLPFETPGIPLSMLWHPRLDADPVHRWLRGCVQAVCVAGPS